MLSIDVGLIVISVIVWILVFVLNKVYFKPVSRIMGERDSKVQQDRSAAQEALEKYDKNLARIEGELNSAKVAAREIREKFDREAQAEKEKILEEVSRECRAQVEEAKKELSEKAEQLKKELEPRSRELAEKIEKRLLN
jgi:F-type H+-transporting ATPase subunit b